MLAARKRRRFYDLVPGAKKNRRLDALTGAVVLLISNDLEMRRTLEAIATRRPCTLRHSNDIEVDQTDVDIVATDLPVRMATALAQRTPRPVVLLALTRDITDLVLALEAGIADYVEAGLSSRIIEARLNAALRALPRPRLRAEFPGLTIDVDARRVFRDGEEVALTRIEFDLLTVLAWNAGQVMHRDELLKQVWGYEQALDTITVNQHIVRLRQKIEPDRRNPTYIRTIQFLGYCFTPRRLDGG